MKDSVMRELSRSGDVESLEALAREGVRNGLDFADAFPSYEFAEDDGEERSTDSVYPRIRIDDELFTVSNVWEIGYGDLHELTTEQGECFIVSEDEITAGAAARKRWEDMAKHDPQEFACIVGEETLVAWGLGQSAGPGSDKSARNLGEWLDIVAGVPEEEWASYDHTERDVQRVGKLSDDLGFVPTVAYRCN